ncbi:hypothetical protein lerEdw1_014364 [Lerista edwardsae]|nr:hypothetical protein lerEdw1_014364 [Lerista edwardsae]
MFFSSSSLSSPSVSPPWSSNMAQHGHIWGRRSPNTCRNRDHRRPDCSRLFPHGTAEDDDWETDPYYINPGPGQGFQWAQREISTASIISDLSKSIRDCSLRKSSPDSKKDGADRLQGRQDSAWSPGKDPEGHRPPLCSKVHSSPSLGISRSSVFRSNAAETLDTFFSEKLRTWASDGAQLSDCYENVESLQEEPGSRRRSQRGAEKERTRPGRTSRGQDHSRATPAREDVVGHSCGSRDHCDPGACHSQCLRTLTGKGEAPPHAQEGSRLSTPVTHSTRILPQCQISHLQSCRACQAFNQVLPAGQESPLENGCRGQEGARDGGSRKRRTGSSSQRPDQLSKVQQWLEQTPVEQPPARPRPQRHKGAHRSLDLAERDSWDRDGTPESPAEARRRRRTHREENPNHQPVARILACDDARRSPAACSCLFCERQRPRAKPGAGRKGPDPSAEEVAVQLQAENRVPRIVEAFERRSLREARRAEWERAFQPARPREPERRAKTAKQQRGEARRGHPQSGGKARRPPRPGGPAGGVQATHGARGPPEAQQAAGGGGGGEAAQLHRQASRAVLGRERAGSERREAA